MLKSFYHSIVPDETRTRISTWKRDLLFELDKTLLYLKEEDARQINSRLNKLKGIFAGNRCIIMGNGPSLNQMDLDLFREEYVWGSNKCYLLFERIDWRPSFYVAVDRRVVPDIKDEIKQLVEKLPDTLFFFPYLFHHDNLLTSSPNIYWYYEKLVDRDNSPFDVFSLDASKLVYSVFTVTIAMIQLAVYLGFNPIYLIGCDTNYSIPASVIQEDANGDLLLSMKDDDKNHFSEDYFGKGSKWHAPHVENMLWHYEQVKLVSDKLGIEIYNATVGGKLEVFPRIDYRLILTK